MKPFLKFPIRVRYSILHGTNNETPDVEDARLVFFPFLLLMTAFNSGGIQERATFLNTTRIKEC